MSRKLWTKDDLIAALRLYCITSFGRIHARNPDIIELADVLGRTPSAVALKMVNFASLDPTLEQKGMSNSSKLDREVWDEFFNDPQNLQPHGGDAADGFSDVTAPAFEYASRMGLDVPFLSTRRINQGFFRQLVLAAYDEKCAATGLSSSELLVAGHIVPWSKEPAQRTNPRNGICLNYLFDRAFDRGLISVRADLALQYSSQLPASTISLMRKVALERVSLPSRFLPEPAFFEYHRDIVFRP